MSEANGLYKSGVTILNAATTSNPADTGGGVLAGVYAPASMTGASVSFTASTDGGGTYVPVRDQLGSLVTVTLNAAASFYSLRGVLPFGADFIRVVSASAEGADRALTLVFQRVV
jgi:hypothetical protein